MEMSEPIYRQVQRDLEGRANVGKEQYGEHLTANTKIDGLQYLYEELLDGSNYIRKAMEDRRALIEYVARLEGAARKILTTGENGESLWWHEIDETLRNTLATSPLSGQPQPAPATGWRPIAEAPNGEKLVVGRRLESKRWVMACLYKYEAVSMFYTHYHPIAEPEVVP